MALNSRWLAGTAIAFVSVVTLVTAWTLVLRHRGLADIVTRPVPPLTVSSPAFVDNGTIPGRFTCQAAERNGVGEAGTSPPLAIAAVPPATKTLAIIADDADAPLGFVHWIAFNIPPDLLLIPVGAGSAPALLHGGLTGGNDFGSNTYMRPSSPAHGHAPLPLSHLRGRYAAVVARRSNQAAVVRCRIHPHHRRRCPDG